jgi:hypothetical protein
MLQDFFLGQVMTGVRNDALLALAGEFCCPVDFFRRRLGTSNWHRPGGSNGFRYYRER